MAEITSPVHGIVIDIDRRVGERVDPHDTVATVESTGMRLAVEAGVSGAVQEVRAEAGAEVQPGDVLFIVTVQGRATVDVDVDPPARLDVTCSSCGSTDLQAGFLEDQAPPAYTTGYGRWVEGPLRYGLFGKARRMGRHKLDIEAYRCRRCSHLELFAVEDPD